ncbi:unnamed protein product [Thlaspi arvense]|uniref:C2H2-type domain-containing protein n=1 Tax=Thlaspi arvense TaxID=13288 RepID=A0AAU9SL34_THLAR|nr:unnamed protein product [Thlaspi arvense]
MDLPSLEDVKGDQLFKLAQDLYAKDDYVKALEVIEDLSFVQGKDKGIVAYLQGTIFNDLAKNTENTDLKFIYFLGSVETFSPYRGFSALAAMSLFELAQQIESVLYYKESLGKAKQSSQVNLEYVEYIIKTAESRIAESKNASDFVKESKNCEQEVKKTKENEETRKSESDFVKGLRSYWSGLNVEKRRNFMKVSIADFTSYVKRLYGAEGRDALEKALTSARKGQKWRFWVCRSCSQEFSSAEECKNHFEQEHDAGFQTHVTKDIAQMISKACAWGSKISNGSWEPVDAVAAIEMIRNHLGDVKAFACENGWSKGWPLAADEERSKLLKEIRSLLVSIWDSKVLSCGLQDWVMDLVVSQLEKLEVSRDSLTACRLMETPQSICFLECRELHQILELLKKIKCEREDGTDLVRRAVDSFCNSTRVKEKIDFDTQFSFLLLDKRLLRGKIDRFDDDGTISFLNPTAYYAEGHARGNDISSWLADHSLGDERFRFPRPIRAHNLDIWLAVLRAVQFTCKAFGTKYSKKCTLEHFNKVLIDAKNLCICEDERRRNIPKDQWNLYASLLCDKCEKKRLTTDPKDSFMTKLYFTAVRDILKGVSHPIFDLPDLEDCLNVIRGCKNVRDELVLKSIDHLKSLVTKKVPLIASKVLLIENSMVNLLNYLTRLSVFDYRSYILGPMKEFLLEELAAAQADLLSERKQEKEKNSGSKKKKSRNKKRTSTSTSGILDQNVEHESSVNLDLGVTSPSLKKAEEDSMEHVSSITDNQEDAAIVMQNMPGEDSLSKHSEPAHGEGPSRYCSALDMTLKSLCNIKVLKDYLVQNRSQFFDNLEGQEGIHSCLLSELLTTLAEVHSMSSDVAELLVAILESWHCWKSPARESLVTRLFTLEEYERINCSRCRKEPNYPEQSSYGVVMAADSIRDLKRAFGDIKFEDILKMIRLEEKMLCDIKTGGCGKANFVHHVISACPPIFTIVLQWEKNETEEEQSETILALDWEIDISRLYEGLEPNTKYRLVSMNMEMQIGCDEEEEYICLAYKKNRWVSFRHEALAKEVVGKWNSVVVFCGKRKVRPEFLFYEANK